jgi:protein-S-isoprenylcysteine O-methyltransferase Ste14
VTRVPSLGPRGEGWVALQGVLFVLIALADEKGPAIPVPDSTVGGWAGALGWAAVVVAGVLIVSSSGLLSRARAFTAVPRPRGDSVLVDSGPYRLVRHPIYAGLVLGAFGLTLVRLTWISLGLAVALFLVLDVKRRREEAWLVERYDRYAGYRARTKALIPFLY